MSNQKSNEQFKKDMAIARTYVSAELKQHNIDIDVRLLTTISVLTSISLKYIDGILNESEARTAFNEAMTMYNNDKLPF